MRAWAINEVISFFVVGHDVTRALGKRLGPSGLPSKQRMFKISVPPGNPGSSGKSQLQGGTALPSRLKDRFASTAGPNRHDALFRHLLREITP